MRRTDRSATRPQTVSIQVSRAERDALHPELTFGLYGTPPDLGSREQAVDYRRRLDLVVDLHDALGWSTDDDRQHFTITTDAEALRRWLTDVRSAAMRAVRDEHRALRDLLEERPHGDEATMASSVRETKEVIDGDLETIHACDALLRRLPDPDVDLPPSPVLRWRRRGAEPDEQRRSETAFEGLFRSMASHG